MESKPLGARCCYDTDVWEALRKRIAESWAACGAFEWMAFAYLGASSVLICIFAGNLAYPLRLLATQALVATLILSLCWVQAHTASRARPAAASFSSRWWHFWRYWYPHLFFLFCFEELAYLMTLYTPNWQDAKLIAFDYWLTGVYPSVWAEQFATVPRNEFMQLAYLSYFTYLLILGGILYVRREWWAYWSVMTYSMAGYMIGYFIAMFFPVESPWFAMAGSWNASASWWTDHRNSESHRAFWPCARRGLSLGARDRSHRCALGRMEIPA